MQYKTKVEFICAGCGKPITDVQSYIVIVSTPVHDLKCFSLIKEKKTDVPKSS